MAQGLPEGKETLLGLSGICKSYGDLRANDDVSLSLRAGEIHALLGENGAGKSTLVKVIFGLEQADSGTIQWRGRQVSVASPSHARELGIGVVFQHFSLFRALTVAENIVLGLPDAERPRDVAGRIREVSERYGFPLDPDRPLYSLSVGEWQRVEIVRCLLCEPRLLVLDEPTSVLTPQEAELLFATLRRLAAEGCAVLYISHKLSELRELCHRATVMRAGKVVAECDPAVESPQSLAQMMIGHKPRPPRRHGGATPGAPAEPVLSVDSLSVPRDGPFGVDLEDVSLELPAGKVLAIAGIAGNGQQELGDVLSGERAVERGAISFRGRDIGDLPPGARRSLGIHYVPEERNGHGAVGALALWENAGMTARDGAGMVNRGFIDPGAARSFAERVIGDFDVRCSGPGATAASLSGGNLQKFVIGREVSQGPRLLVVMQPTWGVDAGAASEIRQAMLDLAAKGAGVLVVSQDLGEIFEIADLVAVISEGRLSAAEPAEGLSQERVGLLMGAVHGGTVAP